MAKAKVQKGARTSKTTATKAAPRAKVSGKPKATVETPEGEIKVAAGDADAMRAVVEEADLERPVYFTATTGEIWMESPQPQWVNGQFIGNTGGLHMKFNDEGMSPPLYPASKGQDREYVERVEAWMERNTRTVEKIHLTKRGDLESMPPFAKWDVWAAPELVVALQANFGDDADENLQLVDEAARYERDSQNRNEVMAALAALRAGQVAEGATSTADELEVAI